MGWGQEFIAVIGIVLGRNVSWQNEAVLCVCMFSQAEDSETGAAGGLRVIWKVEKQLFTRECYWIHTCYENFLYEISFNESCTFDPVLKEILLLIIWTRRLSVFFATFIMLIRIRTSTGLFIDPQTAKINQWWIIFDMDTR